MLYNKIYQDINGNKSSFIKYFLYFCKKVNAPKELYDKIESLNSGDKNSWAEIFKVFLSILDRHNSKINLDNTKLDTTKNYENSLFLLGLNLIKGYTNYLNDSLSILKEKPMKIDTSETILDLEEEINEVILILEEDSINNDWIGLRNHIDHLQSRLSNLSLEVSTYNNRKVEVMSSVRQKAWLAYIDSGLKNMDLYSTQSKLDIPLSVTTTDIVSGVKSRFKDVGGLDVLNLKDTKVLKAINSIQNKHSDVATDFSLCLRYDLHKKFSDAANDDNFFSKFLDIYHDKESDDVVGLNITGYDLFNIISYEKLNGTNKAKFKFQYKTLGSDKINYSYFYADPSSLISGQQARIGILQSDNSIKIELININNIYNSGVIIKNKSENKPQENKSIFSKAKSYIKDRFSNLFSKKAA
ncbi:hypothetical protein HUU51_04770 [Candidatus Gracilibacteria bacterium]|nr:hypothetical protein [Candidatus Gracilibacteria bacterium]